MPELPTAKEVLRSEEDCEELPHNHITQPWDCKTEYLAVLYKILRKEGVEGLRFAVENFTENPHMSDNQNTCVYTNVSSHQPAPISPLMRTLQVHVKGYNLTRVGPACRIKFSTQRARRRIKWQHSRRLTAGTAVAITTAEDCFQSICKIATIAARPLSDGLDKSPPEIDIFWANVDDAVFDPAEELIMVESRNGYFEAVRHALVGLQHAAETQ